MASDLVVFSAQARDLVAIASQLREPDEEPRRIGEDN